MKLEPYFTPLTKIHLNGSSCVAQWKRTQLASMRMRVRPLVSLRGLRIRRCIELWCRSQTQFGSGGVVAVVQASSYSSNSTLAWDPPYATSEALKLKMTTKKFTRMEEYLNMKLETIKLLEEKLGENLLDIGLAMILWDLTPKTQTTKAKFKKWRRENSCHGST